MAKHNKETAKIAVKMRKFEHFHFLLQFHHDIEVTVKRSYRHNISFASITSVGILQPLNY